MQHLDHVDKPLIVNILKESNLTIDGKQLFDFTKLNQDEKNLIRLVDDLKKIFTLPQSLETKINL